MVECHQGFVVVCEARALEFDGLTPPLEILFDFFTPQLRHLQNESSTGILYCTILSAGLC